MMHWEGGGGGGEWTDLKVQGTEPTVLGHALQQTAVSAMQRSSCAG